MFSGTRGGHFEFTQVCVVIFAFQLGHERFHMKSWAFWEICHTVAAHTVDYGRG